MSQDTPNTPHIAAPEANLIVYNARITTGDPVHPQAEAIAMGAGKILAIGTDAEIMRWRHTATVVIDAKQRRMIPGINDSHTHLIRGGLNYNLELRWDGVASLTDALRMLREQAAVTPAPQWVRVVGGWSEYQFAERRMPSLEEINLAAPDTPVFVLHLYDRAWLNAAALRAVGYTKDTPAPAGGEIERDRHGNPTGLIIARPNASILYATLAQGPKLPREYQINSTRQFMRELNRLGITSVIDAGGGFQNYPDDYAVVQELAARSELTVRIAYNLFTQRPKEELDDFKRWAAQAQPYQGDDFLRLNGAGEMLVFSAADFEDFLEPRPELVPDMEQELENVVRFLVQNRWPFRLHATYDESISRFLDVFEKVDRDTPFAGLTWMFDHAETISERNIERVRTLGGGIAIQHRMAYQGEYFLERYGAAATQHTPPVRKMLAAGLPVGAGTDATRVASYNVWVGLYWLISGRSLGGSPLYPSSNRLSRNEALELYTCGSAWFSNEADKKGRLKVGQLGDLALLSEDFFSIDEARIKDLHAVLTVVGGKVVYAEQEYAHLGPPALPVMPDWSAVRFFGGYHDPARSQATYHNMRPHQCRQACDIHGHRHEIARQSSVPTTDTAFWGVLGCSCFAF